jgi:hypothetical protein
VTEFAARIGRIRMKAGGADVRVLDTKRSDGEGENWRGKIMENARVTADMATDAEPLVGYVVIGVYAGGASTVSFRYDPERSHIPRTLFPAWVEETIRRDMITNREASDTFNEMFEWRDN